MSTDKNIAVLTREMRNSSPDVALQSNEHFITDVHWLALLRFIRNLLQSIAAQFVTDALMMAIWRRGRPDVLLHHSDRRSQYTSDQFQRLMADHGVTCSMSLSGNVWDNAAMESFFSSLKTERTARKVYRTRDEAKADVFDYIERFYNPKRRHSTIGYISPVEFEMKAGLA